MNYSAYFFRYITMSRRRSGRDKKPVVIFDPSAAEEKLPVKSDDLKVKVDKNNVLSTNPWDVTNFEAFMFFECPQCPLKTRDCHAFAIHAAANHAEVEMFTYFAPFPFYLIFFLTFRQKTFC